jgi:hypothetical protein
MSHTVLPVVGRAFAPYPHSPGDGLHDGLLFSHSTPVSQLSPLLSSRSYRAMPCLSVSIYKMARDLQDISRTLICTCTQTRDLTLLFGDIDVSDSWLGTLPQPV